MLLGALRLRLLSCGWLRSCTCTCSTLEGRRADAAQALPHPWPSGKVSTVLPVLPLVHGLLRLPADAVGQRVLPRNRQGSGPGLAASQISMRAKGGSKGGWRSPVQLVPCCGPWQTLLWALADVERG